MRLMTHIVSWYPDLKTSEQLIYTLDKYSQFIELQIPYSDPIADWPVIMNACQHSLDNWIKVKDTFDLAKKVSTKIKSSLLIMTYWNIVFKYWIKKFILDAKKAWINGFIIPDISPENFEEFFEIAKKEKMLILSIFAPTSSTKRMKYLSKYSPDLIYAVSRTWITWSDTSFWNDLDKFIRWIKSIFKWKIALWFWIKEKKDINFLKWKVDIAVIWSELIRRYDKWWIKEVENFLKNLGI